MMFSLIKKRCGIATAITAYDEDIESYIEDCIYDLLASGVSQDVLNSDNFGLQNAVITAVTFYVKAHLGNDRTDTEHYMDLYRKKVFRLTLEGEDDVE